MIIFKLIRIHKFLFVFISLNTNEIGSDENSWLKHPIIAMKYDL